MWMYAGTYRVVTEEQMDEESAWYIVDEVGAAIKHSDQPNVALFPFVYSPDCLAEDPHTITYSVRFPTLGHKFLDPVATC